MNRRDLLAGGGAVLGASLAGCVNAMTGSEPPEPDSGAFRDREAPTEPREVAAAFALALLGEDRETVENLLHRGSSLTADVTSEYTVEQELDFDIPGVSLLEESPDEVLALVELHSADIEDWEEQFRLRPEGGEEDEIVWRVYDIVESSTEAD